MPHLPPGLTYAAVALFVGGILVAGLQQAIGDSLRGAVRRGWRRLRPRRPRSTDDLPRYQAYVETTFSQLKIGFAKNLSITLQDLYVPLQYEQDGQRVDIYRDIQSHQRTVVLGGAGAGKSVLLRHSMLEWAAAPKRFDRVPVLIELNRYNRGGRGIQQLIVDTLNRRMDEGKRRGLPLVDDAAAFVESALADGRLCVFLDGLDEVITDLRAEVALDIKELAEQYPTCQIVVTCRDVAYGHDLEPIFDRRIQVAGFDDAGIRHFLRLNFAHGEDATREEDTGNPPVDSRELVEQFMAALRANQSIMRLARTPLMLALIVSLHHVDPGVGPALTGSRAEFYEHAINHLLRRDPSLGRHPQLARYEPGRKLRVLCAVALAAQQSGTGGGDVRTIKEADLYRETGRLMPRFRLTALDVPKIIDEIVERSQLLVRIDDNNMLYQFAHLTLQEYLAAVELAAKPDELLTRYRADRSRWRETVKLWCAAANSDSTEIIRKIFGGDEQDRLLALECVPEARELDEHLADTIVDDVAQQLGALNSDSRRRTLAALGAVAGDTSVLGERLYRFLCERLAAGGPAAEDAVVALADSRRRTAIEQLSALAPAWAPARAALRYTGELAIPVLATRARDGSLDALDDLAAIATPAAAVAIAELLWIDGPVAARAAWWLAGLLTAPDVEAELIRFDPAPYADDGPTLDWLWKPFVSQDGSAPMVVTMGRVGALIRTSTPVDVPENLTVVDTRVALGCCCEVLVGPADDPRPDLAERLADACRRADVDVQLIQRHVASGSAWYYRGRAFTDLAMKAPTVAQALAVELIEQRAAGWTRELLCRLSPRAMTSAAADLWSSRTVGSGRRQWQSMHEEAKGTTVIERWRTASWTVDTVAGVGALVIAVIRLVGFFFGFWAWGPGWFNVVFLIAFLGFIAGFVGFLVVFEDIAEVALLIGALVLGAVAAGFAVVTAAVTLAGWLGWPTAVAIPVLLTAVPLLQTWWINHRWYLRHNPYPGLLRLDERGDTLIARSAPREDFTVKRDLTSVPSAGPGPGRG